MAGSYDFVDDHGPDSFSAGLYQRPFTQTYTCYSFDAIGRPDLEHGDKVILPVGALKRIQHLKIPYPLLFEITNQRVIASRSRPSQTTVRMEYKDRIKKIYQDRADTAKLGKVERLLQQYTGHEHKLYLKICQKYNLTPQPRYDGRMHPVGGKDVNSKGPKQYCSVLEFSAPEEKTIHIPKWMMKNLGIKDRGKVKLKSAFNMKKGTYVKLLAKKGGFIKLIDKMGPKFLLENSMRFFSVLSVGEDFQIKVGDDTWDLTVLQTKPEDKICILGHVDLSVEVEPPKEEANSSSDDSSFVAGGTIDLSGGAAGEDDEMMAGPNPQWTKGEQDEMLEAIQASVQEFLAEEKEEEAEVLSRVEPPDQAYQAGTSAAANEPVPDGMVLCPHCEKHVNGSAFSMHEMHCARQKQACPTCNARFGGGQLATHARMWHDQTNCNWCGVAKSGQRNLMRHKIKCRKRPTQCEYCASEVPLEQKWEHLRKCDLAHTQCKCGARVRRQILPLHQYTECPDRRAACQYCKLPFKLENLDPHAKPCGSRSEPCYLCGKYVTLALMNDHLDSGCASYTNVQRSIPIEETTMKAVLQYADADIDALMDDEFGPGFMRKIGAHPGLGMNPEDRMLQRALQASMADSGSAPNEQGAAAAGDYSNLRRLIDQASSIVTSGTELVSSGIRALGVATGVGIDQPTEEIGDEERLRRAIEASMTEGGAKNSAPPEEPPRRGTDDWESDGDAGWGSDAELEPDSGATIEQRALEKAIKESIKTAEREKEVLGHMRKRPTPVARPSNRSSARPRAKPSSSAFGLPKPKILRHGQAKPNMRVQLTADVDYFRETCSMNGVDMSTRSKVISATGGSTYLGQKGTIVKLVARNAYVKWDNDQPSLVLPVALLEGLRNSRGDFEKASTPLAAQFNRARDSRKPDATSRRTASSQSGYGRQRMASSRAARDASSDTGGINTALGRLGASVGQPYKHASRRSSGSASRSEPPPNLISRSSPKQPSPKARHTSSSNTDINEKLRRLRHSISSSPPDSGLAEVRKRSGASSRRSTGSSLSRDRDAGSSLARARDASSSSRTGLSSGRGGTKPRSGASLKVRGSGITSSGATKATRPRRKIRSSGDSKRTGTAAASSDTWSCAKCTYMNANIRQSCAVCMQKKGAPVKSRSKPVAAAKSSYRPRYHDQE